MLAWCFKAGVKKSMGDLNVGLFEINNKTNKKQLEGQNSGGSEGRFRIWGGQGWLKDVGEFNKIKSSSEIQFCFRIKNINII